MPPPTLASTPLYLTTLRSPIPFPILPLISPSSKYITSQPLSLQQLSPTHSLYPQPTPRKSSLTPVIRLFLFLCFGDFWKTRSIVQSSSSCVNTRPSSLTPSDLTLVISISGLPSSHQTVKPSSRQTANVLEAIYPGLSLALVSWVPASCLVVCLVCLPACLMGNIRRT